MQKLEPQNQFPVTQENIAPILNAYSIADFTFEPINQGIANTSLMIVSDGKEYVLRTYVQGKKPDTILFELKFQDLLRANNIPVPIVYPNQNGESVTETVVDGKIWHSLLMECIDGQSVTLHPSPALIAELATLQARMHLLGIQFVEEVGKPDKRWEDLHDSLAQKITMVPVENRQLILDFIYRVKAYRYALSTELPYGYNHLDIDFEGNVMTKGGRVTGIVDFDDLDYSPIVVCLGYTLWNLYDYGGEEAARAYMAEYEKIRPLQAIERATLPHVIFFRNYVIGVIRLLLDGEETPAEYMTNILRLEKEIPELKF